MLTETDAIRRADETITAAANARSFYDAQWALDMAYASGVQWGRVSRGDFGHKIRRLPPILDPNRVDVRVTMDFVSEMVERMVASTKPSRIEPIARPAHFTAEGLIAKWVHEKLLTRNLIKMRGLDVWRSLHLPRTVLGTGCIRRQMNTIGRSKKLKQMSERTGKQLELRNIEVSWARVNPFEIIRDPSANSIDPNDNETIFGHEKPRTTEWVKKNFGVEINTETTFGTLLNYQSQVRSATGWMAAEHVTDSKALAVMVYEWFFQDGDKENPWPWHLLAYIDPNEDVADETRLKPLHFGPSPFYGLPFHFIHYKEPVLGPWATGLPLSLKNVQDVNNLAWTTMVRVMIDHQPKWLIEQGTVTDPSGMTNRTDVPLVFTRSNQNMAVPSRVSAPGASPVATEAVGQIKDIARGMANMSAIQFGESVKRGQSGEAYKTVQDSADTVITDMRLDDRLVLEDLLYGTLVDTGRQLRMRRDVARKILGDQFPRRQVSIAFSKPTDVLIESVKVLPSSQRSRTPNEVRDEFTEAAKAGLLEPLAARREMLEQAAVVTDTVMAAAVRKQTLEIEMLRRGETVNVDGGEDHETAIWVLEKLMSGEQFLNFDETQEESINVHWGLHKEALIKLQMLDQQIMQGAAGGMPGAQGTPPANATPNLAQAETVGSV